MNNPEQDAQQSKTQLQNHVKHQRNKEITLQYDKKNTNPVDKMTERSSVIIINTAKPNLF